jgi:DNA-binding NarL/FixJ family response regulator
MALDLNSLPLSTLTQRERQIVALICSGDPNKIIAYKLSLSEGAVKANIYKIFQKLRVRSRCELIVPSSDRAKS